MMKEWGFWFLILMILGIYAFIMVTAIDRTAELKVKVSEISEKVDKNKKVLIKSGFWPAGW